MSENKKLRIITLLIVLVILALNGFSIIDAGHTGVLKTLGKVNENAVRQEGFNFKIPFIQSIIKIDNRVKKSEATATAASKDLQNVTTLIAVNFNIKKTNSSKLYKTVGKEYNNTIIEPAIQEAIKAVTAKYSAENLIVKRDDVSLNIKKILTKKVSDYGIDIKSVNIKNFQFSDKFTEAVEAKQEAEQLALKSKQDLERIKTEAKQKIESAKAEAESLRIQKEEITPELIQLRKVENQSKAINKWDGQLPQTALNDGTSLILGK